MCQEQGIISLVLLGYFSNRPSLGEIRRGTQPADKAGRDYTVRYARGDITPLCVTQD